MKLKRKCLTCNEEFEIYLYEINRAKYCSNKCKWGRRKIEEGENPKWTKIKVICPICKKKFWSYKKPWLHKYCSRKCKGVAQKKLYKGKNNPAWLGGNSLFYRNDKTRQEWNKIRKQIYMRDNFICQNCNKTNSALDVHHIMPLILNGTDNKNNLQALCQSCHRKAEYQSQFIL